MKSRLTIRRSLYVVGHVRHVRWDQRGDHYRARMFGTLRARHFRHPRGHRLARDRRR